MYFMSCIYIYKYKNTQTRKDGKKFTRNVDGFTWQLHMEMKYATTVVVRVIFMGVILLVKLVWNMLLALVRKGKWIFFKFLCTNFYQHNVRLILHGL